ncbi:hypothetical protein PSHT_01367 [Puccinia striiformis]|uniref:Uncharacterized protein n=1 Tax=Puccinia striiformis TaxID=27350 RepID=A0A2S4UNL8_9BASI|nr:hypothetical protein PSHT_13838 [Puccinia striiformis]POW22435.1 hypothetical protein PSHT_01367 [Puccinia striiformis]
MLSQILALPNGTITISDPEVPTAADIHPKILALPNSTITISDPEVPTAADIHPSIIITVYDPLNHQTIWSSDDQPL